MSVAETFVEEDGFGFVPRPDRNKHNKPFDIVRRYTMTNRHKASVQLISWGAGIQAIKVPSRPGILGDVVLGFDDMDGYLKNRYIGSIIGRIVNRVSHAKMRIENEMYCLSVNDKDGVSHFNGGFVGFDNVNWDSCILNSRHVMSHLSPANSEGYPGNMLTQIKYSWTDDNQLHINIRATTTQPTPVNITTNCLMNLAGHATGPDELKKHVISMNAGSWTFADIRDSLPTGAIYPVDRTVFDLRLPTQLTKRRLYIVPGGGYNQNLCITSPNCWCYRFHARIVHAGSGRTLEVYSNKPGLQFSTGNDLPNPDTYYPPDFDDFCNCLDDTLGLNVDEREIWGKDGVRYKRHSGFILSPQNYPDAINISNFPSCILYPGQVYSHDLTYKFGLLSKNSYNSDGH
ncbi:PREDICTED: aldose 1-epimerase-like [Habropoda laboriosa]|uniref:aldose 1-epimerase-like n=1 Tax=Habropoda laboriosa TaxID=597456 RepID=UPI00083E5BA1|nr:PREDICTED: aldose 1-epimerase-like [Habropoda laboriosa]